MKNIIVVSVLALSISGCVAPGYNADKDKTYQPFSTSAQGVRAVPGQGFGYFRGQPKRTATKEELDYLAANQVDFAQVSRNNAVANAESNAREEKSLKDQTPKMSCLDMVQLQYRVVLNQAQLTGDWSQVYSYNYDSQKLKCKGK